jgi:cytochrome c2
MSHEPHRSTASRLSILAVTLSVGAATLVGCGSLLSAGPTSVVSGGDPDLGKAALVRYGCVTCHVVPGIRAPESYVGPPLTAWAKRRYIAGTLANEPDNLIHWIMDPRAIHPGTAMPDLGVDDADARDMAAYLYTIEE